MVGSDGERLARMGTDGAKWATEFVTAAFNMKRPATLVEWFDPTPGNWLHTWFANAIEAGRTAGYAKAMRDLVEQDAHSMKDYPSTSLWPESVPLVRACVSTPFVIEVHVK